MRSVTGTKPTPATNADMSPQERWLAAKDADRADPWLHGDRVLKRNKSGELVQHEKIVGADGTVTAGKILDENGQPVADDDARPSGEADGEKTVTVGDVTVTEAELKTLMELKAQQDLRAASRPATPEGYRLELPRDMKTPAGAPVFQLASLDDPAKGPGLRAAMEFAHARGFSQEDFSSMLGVYAASQAREQTMIEAAIRAEREKLGANGTARVDAVAMFLRGRYGDDAGRAVMKSIVLAKQLEVWEDIVSRAANSTGSSFSRRGIDLEPTTIDDASWDKMSYPKSCILSCRYRARSEWRPPPMSKSTVVCAWR